MKLFRKSKRGKSSSYRPKKPEKLGVEPFDGATTNTQRFIQDVEIKLNYFRDSLADDMDKISLVIPLLKGPAKRWYHGIHRYISEDAAKREGKPFDPNNVLRTWEGFRTQFTSSFGGNSDRDRALREWNNLTMQPGVVDVFIDELTRLASELMYTGDFVKDKARIGMTTALRNAWAMMTPHPAEYIEYLDRLRKTGHSLE